MNDSITIYPTDKGWIRIKDILMKKYGMSDFLANEWIIHRQTPDGGYRDQHWVIIADLHEMFFNGQTYLLTKINISDC